ncbi:MAG: hypothetical protein ACM3SV_02735 [Betaproteobacteria bacterium]
MKKIASLFALLALPSLSGMAAGLDTQADLRFTAKIYPKNATVTMMLVQGSMRSRLTGLMGEPVLNHQVKLDPYMSTFVRLPDGQIRDVAELTPEIRKAAQKIRFTLVGALLLGSQQPQYHAKTFIPFDSGASVSPADGAPFNVPGSPAWGNLVRTDACGNAWLDEKTARQIAAGFEKKEFWIAGAEMCSDKTEIDDSAVREAIAQACAGPTGGTGKLPAWCGQQSAKSKEADKNTADPRGKAPGKAPSGVAAAGAPETKSPTEKDSRAKPGAASEAKPGRIVFEDNFRKAGGGWAGSVGNIETAGCHYLGASNSGIHMAYEPAGPLYRDITGLQRGKTYTISFEVKTLDPRDAGLATFSIDDAVVHKINANGPVSIPFVATKPTHRIQFNWGLKAITWAPIHITALKIVPGGLEKTKATAPEQRFVGEWKWRERGSDFDNYSMTVVSENGKLKIAQHTIESLNMPPLKEDARIENGKLVFAVGKSASRSQRFSLDIDQMVMTETYIQYSSTGKITSDHYTRTYKASKKQD